MFILSLNIGVLIGPTDKVPKITFLLLAKVNKALPLFELNVLLSQRSFNVIYH